MQTARPAPVPSVLKAVAAKSVAANSDAPRAKLQKEARTIIATAGRDAAIAECRRKVTKISRECRMNNIKYRDPHFDLSTAQEFCLNGLRQKGEGLEGVEAPGAVRRVEDIYDDPKFIVDGINAGDIKQGGMGDCWFLAALATIANVPQLLESICVARDERKRFIMSCSVCVAGFLI